LESDLQYFKTSCVNILNSTSVSGKKKLEAIIHDLLSVQKDFVRAFPNWSTMKIKTCTVINQPQFFMPDQHIGVSKRSVDISDKASNQTIWEASFGQPKYNRIKL
jgi:hypothetical protein